MTVRHNAARLRFHCGGVHKNRHLVLVPSYNTGRKLIETVITARRYWEPVWVVIDGSTDGSGEVLARMSWSDSGLRVIYRPRNGGKGAALLDGLNAAAREGFTHVLTMDADGQHPAESIPAFMALSCSNPEAMILGVPIFDSSAPKLRVAGRRLSNVLVRMETRSADIQDSLFGFRVYPIVPLKEIMQFTNRMRRFDFDVEVVVRLFWRGVPVISQAAPVSYYPTSHGGVSHFNYVRDNALLTSTHARLLVESFYRWAQAAGRLVRSYLR